MNTTGRSYASSFDPMLPRLPEPEAPVYRGEPVLEKSNGLYHFKSIMGANGLLNDRLNSTSQFRSTSPRFGRLGWTSTTGPGSYDPHRPPIERHKTPDAAFRSKSPRTAVFEPHPLRDVPYYIANSPIASNQEDRPSSVFRNKSPRFKDPPSDERVFHGSVLGTNTFEEMRYKPGGDLHRYLPSRNRSRSEANNNHMEQYGNQTAPGHRSTSPRPRSPRTQQYVVERVHYDAKDAISKSKGLVPPATTWTHLFGKRGRTARMMRRRSLSPRATRRHSTKTAKEKLREETEELPAQFHDDEGRSPPPVPTLDFSTIRAQRDVQRPIAPEEYLVATHGFGFGGGLIPKDWRSRRIASAQGKIRIQSPRDQTGVVLDLSHLSISSEEDVAEALTAALSRERSKLQQSVRATQSARTTPTPSALVPKPPRENGSFRDPSSAANSGKKDKPKAVVIKRPSQSLEFGVNPSINGGPQSGRSTVRVLKTGVDPKRPSGSNRQERFQRQQQQLEQQQRRALSARREEDLPTAPASDATGEGRPAAARAASEAPTSELLLAGLRLRGNMLTTIDWLPQVLGPSISKSLQWLDLSMNNFRHFDLQVLLQFPSLHTLELQGNGIRRIVGWRCVADLPPLRSLSLHHNPLLESDPQAKFRLQSLLPGLTKYNDSVLTAKDKQEAKIWEVSFVRAYIRRKQRLRSKTTKKKGAPWQRAAPEVAIGDERIEALLSPSNYGW